MKQMLCKVNSLLTLFATCAILCPITSSRVLFSYEVDSFVNITFSGLGTLSVIFYYVDTNDNYYLLGQRESTEI